MVPAELDLPPVRSGETPSPGNHAEDHNKLRNALASLPDFLADLIPPASGSDLSIALALAFGRRDNSARGHLAHSAIFTGPDRAIPGTRAKIGGRRYRSSGLGTQLIEGNRFAPHPVPGAATILYVDDLRGVLWTRMSFVRKPGTTDNENAVIGWCRIGFGAVGDPTLGGPESGGGSIQLASYGGFWRLFCVRVKELDDPTRPPSGGLIDPYTTLRDHVYETPQALDDYTTEEYYVGYHAESSSMTVISVHDGSVETVENPLINQYIGNTLGLQERRTFATDGHVEFTGWDHWVDDITAARPLAPPLEGAVPLLSGDGYAEFDIDWTPTGVLRLEAVVNADNLGAGHDETFGSVWSRVSGAQAFDFRVHTTQQLSFTVSTDGSTDRFGVSSTQDVPRLTGDVGVAVEYDPVGGNVDFETSVDDGASWQALGTTQTTPGGLPFNGGEPLKLGMRARTNAFHGAIKSFRMVDDGVTIASPDWTGPFTGTDDQGNQAYYINAGFGIPPLRSLEDRLEKVIATVTPDPIVAQVVNTTAETTLFAMTIPAGAAEVGDLLEVDYVLDSLNDSGANTTTQYKVKLGATTVFDFTTGALATGLTRRHPTGTITIKAVDLDQLRCVWLHDGTTPGTGVGAGNAVASARGTLEVTAEDLSTDTVLTVTVKHANAHANIDTRLHYAELRRKSRA